MCVASSFSLAIFLSTLPARGATTAFAAHFRAVEFLSTLPARGATKQVNDACDRRKISIHAPREGSDDFCAGCINVDSLYFYPRSPRGERPLRFAVILAQIGISIHAPREGSDLRQR